MAYPIDEDHASLGMVSVDIYVSTDRYRAINNLSVQAVDCIVPANLVRIDTTKRVMSANCKILYAMKQRYGSTPNVGFTGDVEQGMPDFHCYHGPPVFCRGV